MTARRLRVLYLSMAFPPGVSGRFPGVNPAGHANETRLAEGLAKFTDLRTVGLLPEDVWGRLEPRDGSLGLEHDLLLWDRKPELWHRWHSWRTLRKFYLQSAAQNGLPDVVLVRNLTPVFNVFARWLRRLSPRPRLILLFADSSTLGNKSGFSRRLRYSLKPMHVTEANAIACYDGCIAYGIKTRDYFEHRQIPWLWMPSAYNFRYEPPPAPVQPGPIRFGYFGALAEHAAVMPTIRTFLEAQIPGSFHICGYGKLADDLKQLAQANPSLHFDGLLPTQQDCLAWAQRVDVLINPRLEHWGLENSFPSKIFEYGMTGRAILSTRTGGVDQVLLDDGLYLDARDFENSLQSRLHEISAMDRSELLRRGTAIRQRILKDFNWDVQARRMTDFMEQIALPARTPSP